MEASSGGLDMIFQLLAPAIPLILVFNGFGPDATRYPSDDAVFRIHSIAEKERKVGGKIIDIHPSGKIIFYIGKAIGQRKSQLRNRVGAGFRDVIAADGDTIEIAYILFDKPGLDISH